MAEHGRIQNDEIKKVKTAHYDETRKKGEDGVDQGTADQNQAQQVPAQRRIEAGPNRGLSQQEARLGRCSKAILGFLAVTDGRPTGKKRAARPHQAFPCAPPAEIE